jgi:hypothetical protein
VEVKASMSQHRGDIPRGSSAAEFVKSVEPYFLTKDELVSVFQSGDKEVTLSVRESTPFVKRLVSENSKIRIIVVETDSYVTPYG